MLDNNLEKKPCAKMLKINEELKGTDLHLFLSRKDVKNLIANVKQKFHALIDEKKDGLDHLELAKAEECVDITVGLIKQTLKEKIVEAARVFVTETESILGTKEELEQLDETTEELGLRK